MDEFEAIFFGASVKPPVARAPVYSPPAITHAQRFEAAAKESRRQPPALDAVVSSPTHPTNRYDPRCCLPLETNPVLLLYYSQVWNVGHV